MKKKKKKFNHFRGTGGDFSLTGNAHKQHFEARGSSGKGRKSQAVLSCRHQSQSNLLHAYQ